MVISLYRQATTTSISALNSFTSELRQSLAPTSSSFQQQIRTATKRGGGSSKNGRSSAGRRLGVKKFTDQFVAPGEIIVRQRGTQFNAGQHVGMGKDHTLFALQPGYIKFYSSPSPFPHRSSDSPSTASSSSTSTPFTLTETPLTGLVKRPKQSRQYIGIVATRTEKLPRIEEERGRDRRFWMRDGKSDEVEAEAMLRKIMGQATVVEDTSAPSSPTV